MRYRKKPVEIDAWRVRELIVAARDNWDLLPGEIKTFYESGGIIFEPKQIRIRTLEGIMTGAIDDMLIRGIKGEYYPCKPDIFFDSYEKVDAIHAD